MREMTLDEIKNCTVGILDFIKKICLENHLQFFLGGGTLLGAVRHKGFIPWDDDIDLMMPRKDYELLFKVWPHDSVYELLCYQNTNSFPYAFGKAIDTRTVKIEPIRLSCQHIGVDVDIFPIDSLPDSDEETVLFFKGIDDFQNRLDRHIAPYGRARNLARTVARNAIILIRRSFELLGINTVDKIVSSFSSYAQRYNGQDTLFCGVTTISHYGVKEKNPKTAYDNVVNVEFEGKIYPAPIGFDGYLTRLYGKDYMQLPPFSSRQSHHSYKAYWK